MVNKTDYLNLSPQTVMINGFEGMSGLAPKWVRIAPSGTNLGLFQIRIQYIVARIVMSALNFKQIVEGKPFSLCTFFLHYTVEITG